MNRAQVKFYHPGPEEAAGYKVMYQPTTICKVHGYSQKDCFNEKIIGLDPIFRSHIKLPIHDIFRLQVVLCPSLQNKELLSYRGHVVSRVEIMGLLVRVKLERKRHLYAVDDGTGVIQCTRWKNNHFDSPPTNLQSELPPALRLKFQELVSCSENLNDGKSGDGEEGFSLGDLVFVRGRVNAMAENNKEIDVSEMHKVDNSCLEMERALSFPKIQRIYDQPSSVPVRIQESLLESSVPEVIITQRSIQRAIEQHLEKPNASSANLFTPEDILSWKEMKALVEVSSAHLDERTEHGKLVEMVTSALDLLEECSGLVYKKHETQTPLYEVVSSECQLAITVLALLKQSCKDFRDADRGCHILSLLSKVRANKKYRFVKEKVLHAVLSCLEANSDVIDVGYQRYLPLDV